MTQWSRIDVATSRSVKYFIERIDRALSKYNVIYIIFALLMIDNSQE